MINFIALCCVSGCASGDIFITVPPPKPKHIVCQGNLKEADANFDEPFYYTYVSSNEGTIVDLEISCGCGGIYRATKQYKPGETGASDGAINLNVGHYVVDAFAFSVNSNLTLDVVYNGNTDFELDGFCRVVR